MKVAFTGKGGSGKTTLASSFARQLVGDGYSVLAFDADINQHLAAALNVSDVVVSMGEESGKIMSYLKGDNVRFTSEKMHKTTPPGTGSRLVELRDEDWFIRRYALKRDGIYVAGAGEIPEGNIGVKCYHGLNGAIELVLGHFIDTADEFIVVDMTAGADAFSSSLFTKVDALVLVVEPTLKSLSVYDQFLPHAKAHGIPLFVVGNKIETEHDRRFIEERTGVLTTAVEVSGFIKRKERGQVTPEEYFEQTMTDSLRELRQVLLQQVTKDWTVVEKRSYDMHRKNAKSWMGESALSHIDPDFSLKDAAETLLRMRR